MKPEGGTLLALTRLITTLTVLAALGLSVPLSLYTAHAAESGVERIQVTESRRIAVLDFDFDSVSLTGIALNLYGGSNGAARGISNMLTNRLVQDGTYTLVERSRIDAILAEQNLGQSDRIEPTTAAQIGRLLGVDAVLLGSITQFHVEDQSQGVSVGRFFGLGGRQQRQNATVRMTTRLVSTATGEILAVADGAGQADQVSGSASFSFLSGSAQSDSRDRLLGEAANTAVGDIVTKLVSAAPQLAKLPPVLPVESMTIADVNGGQVILNRGGQHGFRPGMVLSVERVIREVKDPETGRVLRAQTESIGQLQLTEVDPQSSVARVLSGQGFRVGDRAKAIPN
ncbi:penicillin-binding protein activator LpoB [Synechococcales cyanobacterium C]|uniref:Penicillin-binding protein activator LpoB n=1 Tax=Petrachloros mirabilis ULC683 TaxID=2781853 RepID=A0A8K2AGV4_9CYAN|nr:penicillin-binding protein activator LpoB [Petrachloros mirabilis ULC683]